MNVLENLAAARRELIEEHEAKLSQLDQVIESVQRIFGGGLPKNGKSVRRGN